MKRIMKNSKNDKKRKHCRDLTNDHKIKNIDAEKFKRREMKIFKLESR